MRQHSGGYINEAAYWDIGTDERRGRDGDTARDAARKYNDHKHPAAVIVDAGDLHAWANEPQLASAGGYLANDPGELARSPGDMALFNGGIYVSDGEGGALPLSGLGGRVVINGSGDAVIVPDRVTLSQSISTDTRVAVGGVSDGVTRLVGRVVLRDDAARADAADKVTRLRVVSAIELSLSELQEQLLLQALTVGDVVVAPFATLTAVYTPIAAGGFASVGDATAAMSAAALLGLTGDVPQQLLDARGLDAAAWHSLDVPLVTGARGVLTVSATLASLDDMCTAAGVSTEQITEQHRDLWRQLRAQCTLHVVSAQLDTLLTFGG